MKRLALVALVVLLAATLGPVSHGSAQTPRDNVVQAIMKLQVAAADLVRETSYGDKDGSSRAYKAFQTLFTANKNAIKARAPDAEERMADAFDAVHTALQAGNLHKASTAAAMLLDAVNDAAALIVGQKGGPTGTLLIIVEQLKADAHDLEQEASSRDMDGTRQAFTAFQKLFTASKDKIKAKAPKAEERIADALTVVGSALKAGNLGKVHAAAVSLVSAVSEAATAILGPTGALMAILEQLKAAARPGTGGVLQGR